MLCNVRQDLVVMGLGLMVIGAVLFLLGLNFAIASGPFIIVPSFGFSSFALQVVGYSLARSASEHMATASANHPRSRLPQALP